MQTRRLRFGVVVALATVSLGVTSVSAQPPQEDKALQQALDAQHLQEAIKAEEKMMKESKEKAQAYMGDWVYPAAEYSGTPGSTRNGQILEMRTTGLTHDAPAKVWKYYLEQLPLLDKQAANWKPNKEGYLSWDTGSGGHTVFQGNIVYVDISLPSAPRTFGRIFIQKEEWMLLLTVYLRTPVEEGDPWGTTVIEILKRQLHPITPAKATAQPTNAEKAQ